MERARARVDSLTRELVVGDIFTGKVTRITNFGVFVELVPGRDGLLRNGEMGDLEEDDVKMGQEVTVVLHEIDPQGRINLSRRAQAGGHADPVLTAVRYRTARALESALEWDESQKLHKEILDSIPNPRFIQKPQATPRPLLLPLGAVL